MSMLSPALRTEVRENLKLAWPLIVAQLAAVGMGAIDTVFAGRVGPHALAAVAVGVNLNVVFYVPVLGLMMAVSALVANQRGAGRTAPEIGAFLRRTRGFALLLGLLWFAGFNLVAAPALRALKLAPETTALAIDFCRCLSFSAFGFSLFFALRFGAEGAGRTRPILIVGLVGLAVNTLIDWLLVFGHAGAPRLGALGCGVATSLSTWLMAALLWLLYHRSPTLRVYLVRDGEAAAGIAELLRLGGPIGAIMLAEAGLFVTTAMLMARFGDRMIAAYQVAINFASLVFMIPIGIAQATTVRVGLAAGAGERAQTRYRGRVGMLLGLLNAASNATIMLLFAPLIVAVFTRDASIAGPARRFLWLAAAFQFFDGLQSTANGALRGIKDTRLPMAITLFAYWGVGMPVAVGLAFAAAWGPDGLWWGLTAGLGIAALGLPARFNRRTA